MSIRLPALRDGSELTLPRTRRAEPDSPAFYDAHWSCVRSDADPFVVRKAAEILAIIPPDVQSIIDIGCGDGTLTAALAAHFRVQAVDRSAQALSRVAERLPGVVTVQASADALPLPAKSADLVFSSELLEHLPDAVRIRATQEMARVTRRWLLLSVPHEEVLRRRFAACSHCGLQFHVYGHLHSFSAASLAAAFPDFTVRARLTHGRPETPTHAAIEAFRQEQAGRWFVYPGLRVTCPACGNHDFAPPKLTPMQQGLNALADVAECAWRLGTGARESPYWLTLLLERTPPTEVAPAPPTDPELVEDVTAVVAGRVAVAALESLKFFALVRLLDKSAYGTLAFALTWHMTAVTLGTLAIPDSLLALLPRATRPQQAALAHQSLQFLTALGGLAGVLLLALLALPSLLPTGQPALPGLLPWIALAVAADLPAQMLQAFLLGIQQHRAAAIRALGLAALANLALLIPVLAGASLPVIAASFALACVARLAVTAWSVRRAFADVASEPYPGGLRAQLRMAIPLSVTGVVSTVNRQLTTWTAGFLLPAALFADFAVGAQELPLVAMLPNAVAVALLPRLTQQMSQPHERPAGLALWHASMLRVALLMLPVWVWCSVEAVPLLTALGGPEWASAALPFRITALLLPLRLTAYGTLLLALGLPRHVLMAQLVALATTLLSCAALWLLHGQALLDAQTALVGGCAAFVLSQFAAIALLLQSIARACGLPWHQAFPWRAWALRLVVAAAMMVPLQLIHGADSTDAPTLVVQLVVRAAAYAALTLAAFWHLGLLTAADRAVVRRLMRRE